MSFLMCNDVAMCCNLKGRNNKKAFGTSPLYHILFSAAKANAPTAECTLKDLEVALSKWLVGSRDRDGNRAKREKRTHQEAFKEKNISTGFYFFFDDLFKRVFWSRLLSLHQYVSIHQWK